MRFIRWFGDTVAQLIFWFYLVAYLGARSLLAPEDPFWQILPAAIIWSLVMTWAAKYFGFGETPGAANSTPISTSVRAAVDRGHAIVTKRVFAIMAVVFATGAALILAFDLVIIGLVVMLAAPFAGWIWWSYATPRWRRWAQAQGVDAAELQRVAERERLVWPRGHFFERTEFRIRDDPPSE